MTACVYALCSPSTHTIRYVGRTVDVVRRFREHLKGSNPQTPVAKWIRKLRGRSLLPICVVLEQEPADLREAEQFWIARLRTDGARLLNLNNGGDGQVRRVVSVQTRKRMSKAARNRSSQHQEKITASLRQTRGRRKPVSEEHRANLSRVGKGRVFSAESRQKMREAAVRRCATPEWKAEARRRMLELRASND